MGNRKNDITRTEYDIGLVGNWSGYNYGAHITHYALYRYLSDLGYKVLMIEKTDTEPFKPLSEPKLFKSNPYRKEDISKLYTSLEDMRELNEICKLFIVGSDQLWSYLYFGHGIGTFGLSFVNAENKKISYATSFGINRLEAPFSHINKLRLLLNRFNYVSVREKSGITICKNLGIDATHVVDPVFLCNRTVYDKMIENSCLDTDSKYIFCYIIHPNENNLNIIKRISKYTDMKVICVGDALEPKKYRNWDIECVYDVKVEDWIKLIRDSSYVIADSFHAFCFSLIFNKHVIVCGEDRDRLERVYSLSEIVGVRNVFEESELLRIDTAELLETTKIDYSQVTKLLNKEIRTSKDWLKSALESDERNIEMGGLYDCEEFISDYYDLKQNVYDLNEKITRVKTILLRKMFENKYGNKDVIIFGAGNVGKLCFERLKGVVQIEAFSDNNADKHGVEIYKGVKCIPPCEIISYNKPLVIVCINNISIKQVIMTQLGDMGVENVIDYEYIRKELLDQFI